MQRIEPIIRINKDKKQSQNTYKHKSRNIKEFEKLLKKSIDKQ